MSKPADPAGRAGLLGSRVPQPRRASNPDGSMPLIEHIRELRSRVVKAVLGILVGMAVGLYYFDPIWKFLEHPFCTASISGRTGCKEIGDQLVVTNILDPFMLRLKVAFFVGLIITSPIWFYQLWAFLAPGLYRRERRYTYLFVGTAVPLFLVGSGLAYEVMSRGLHYLLSLAPSGIIQLPTVDTYLSYTIAMLLGFGLAFELPLILVMLNLVGILKHTWFRKWRRLMIFVVFVFSGMASPSPDPITMLLLAVPCLVLVEVAEVIIWANDRRRERAEVPFADLPDDVLSPLDPSAGESVGADQ